MRVHSAIIDNFLDDPMSVRKEFISQTMMDYKASDGVVYPGIIDVRQEIKDDIIARINAFVSPGTVKESTIFARFSSKDMNPPHWAHSDLEMSKSYVCFLYLNPTALEDHGTFLVSHKELGFNSHPSNEAEIEAWRRDTNDKSKWNIDHACSGVFNRMFLISSDLLHAASRPFGLVQEDSRLVLVSFIGLN